MPRKKVAAKAKELVRLREKKLSNGNTSLYLDYYKDGKREYEFLRLYLIPEKTPFDKLQNENTRNSANAIKADRNIAIIAKQAGLKRVVQSKLLLSDWMNHCIEEAEKKSIEGQNRNSWARILRQTATIVNEYAEGVKLVDVDKDFVRGLIDWLQYGYTIKRAGSRCGIQNEGKHLAPKTAQKKYACFHYMMKKALDKELINKNPCDFMKKEDKIKVPESTRAYLTIDELKRLEETPTESEGTRQAYLFMCYCGLRISDVKRLRWADIEQRENRIIAAIRQQKTQEPLYLPLSDKAQGFMPPRGEKSAECPVFDLPTEPAMNRALKAWAKKAGVTKSLTLHTARHTFATSLLTKGAELYTVSKLLGHSSVATTQVYARIVDKKKEEAVDLLNIL